MTTNLVTRRRLKGRRWGRGRGNGIETLPSSSSDDEIYPPSEDEAPCARNGGSKRSLYHGTGGQGEAAGADPAAATDDSSEEDSERCSERGPAKKKRGDIKVCRGSCRKSFSTRSNIRKHYLSTSGKVHCIRPENVEELIELLDD